MTGISPDLHDVVFWPKLAHMWFPLNPQKSCTIPKIIWTPLANSRDSSVSDNWKIYLPYHLPMAFPL